MQLSAPASAPFSDALLPVSTGDVAADALLAGEAPATDFGALFAGLTRAPSAAAGPRGQIPVIVGPIVEKPVSKLQLQGEEAALAAAMVALALPPESTSAQVTIVSPPAEEPATPTDTESVPAEVETEAIEVSTHSGAVPIPAPGGPFGVARGPEGVPGEHGKHKGASVALPDRSPQAAIPASPATPAAPVAAKLDPASIASDVAPVAEEADATPASVASSTSPGEVRRLAAGVSLAADPAAPGQSRSQEARTRNATDPLAKTSAKIAADAFRGPAASEGRITATEKNFLTTDNEVLTDDRADVGTGIALRESAMTTSAPATASTALAPVGVASREPAFDLGTPPSLETKVSVPEPIERLAHRAVEAVTETIERGASQTPSSVNLKFSVQGADLMVRVALRAEEVQVTFRTDSEDLRNALAQEWQLVRGRDADGVLQSVTPVFTAGDSGHSTSQQHFGGRDQAANFANLQAQADAQSQRQFSRQAPLAPVAPTAGAPASAGVPASVTRPLSGEASGAARLLHTFA